jgi:hypothetical protein
VGGTADAKDRREASWDCGALREERAVVRMLRDWPHTRRSHRIYWLLIILTVIHIVPMWAFRYFPSQDGPSHVENAYLLLHYFDEDTRYRTYFDLNPAPLPTWFSHATLACLMVFLSPLVAQKVLLTIYVIVFVASMLYFLRSVGEESVFFMLLAFPFAYSYLFHMGFYNYAFSFPLTFLVIGYWWRRRERGLRWRLIIELNLLLILLYFCHVVSQLLAFGSILLLSVVVYRSRFHRVFAHAAALIPSLLLPLYFVCTREPRYHRVFGLGKLARDFVTMGPLVYYDTRQVCIGVAFAILFALAIANTLVGRMRQLVPRQPRSRLRPQDGWLLLGLAFTGLFFFMPQGMYGGGAIAHRLNAFPYIAILPWLSTKLRKPLKLTLGVAAVALILVQFGIATHYYRIFNNGLREFTSGVRFVGKNKTVLPLIFDHRGESARIEVYRHAGSYYCLETGAINLANYEAMKDYFPVEYKPLMNPLAVIGWTDHTIGNINPEAYPGGADYVLLWCPRRHFMPPAWLERRYRLIHAKERVRLYRHIAESD